ncbi:hypothetical protein [Burkholderia sp. MSHR3999]|uniref:hypothetical protein n=1 Tax=Burkholderia sp. MSHR3999 TaxID=1542965 RepID=UPI0005ACA7A9|nr:hypothetical protein [Burkholderia sp. MSHR3999]
MGPEQTEFWLKLRSLIDHPEWIEDFSRIVKLFGLTITEPMDAITIDTPGIKSRHDARDLRYFSIKTLSYRIAPDDYEKNLRVLRLQMQLNLDQICITDQAVRRIYGHGYTQVPSHGEVMPGLQADPTGVLYFGAYGGEQNKPGRAPWSIVYLASGCAMTVTLQRLLHN